MTERDDEKRTAGRQVVYVASEIVTEAGVADCAITHDASATGLLLLTCAKLELGQTIRLRVHTRDGATPSFDITGRVVRREPLDPSETDVWYEKVAVALDSASAELARELEALSRKQATIYGTKP